MNFFDCPVGVRQGCVLSPTIFSLLVNQLSIYITETGRHGIQLLSGLVELFILFADDVALLATTPYGLPNQLYSLKACCGRLQMEVNKDKTKDTVFQKGGYLTKHEKWYYDGRDIEVVNKYHYLGFALTTTLSVKQGTDHLVAKGKKDVFILCTSFQKCREMTKETFFKIFDSKIQSVLLYSSVIWGLHILDSIERVHLMACKRYLGVPSRTANKMVYGEFGRYPLFVAYVRCIKYWFLLLYMEQSRLPNRAYRMLVNLDENGEKCWTTEVGELMCKNGFYFV